MDFFRGYLGKFGKGKKGGVRVGSKTAFTLNEEPVGETGFGVCVQGLLSE